MGIRERQDRERQAVHDRILAAARDLFVTEGFEHVSMRKIAERIEYSPAAIYSYFANKEEIFYALAEEGFRVLDASGIAERCLAADPHDGVRQMLFAYYRFARDQPQFFALMFLDRSVPRLCEQWDRDAFMAASVEAAVSVIRRATDAGVFPADTDPCALFHVLWAAVHGATAVAVCGRLGPDEDPDALVHDVIETVIAGARAGVRPTFVPFCPQAEALAPAVDAESRHAPS
jgi:AcrR family transcriptional regulator